MERLPVKSSHIAAIGFADGALEVEFTSGRVYGYRAVPEPIYEMLMDAPSVGKAFHALIRGKYAEQDITSFFTNYEDAERAEFSDDEPKALKQQRTGD